MPKKDKKNMMGVSIPINVEFREWVDENKRVARFTLSSETPDSYGTVFSIKGWELERYAKNPVVTYQHLESNYESKADPDIVIGKSRVYIDGGELIGELTFEPPEINEMAEKIRQKVDFGSLRGASIRAHVHEGHWGESINNEDPDIIYFTRHELLAWSIVVVPSNGDAVLRSDQDQIDAVKERFKKTDTQQKTTDESGQSRALDVIGAQILINKNLSR